MDRPGDARGLNAPYRANRTRAGGDLGRMDWSLKVLADVALDPKASARAKGNFRVPPRRSAADLRDQGGIGLARREGCRCVQA
jgi:hypothetical protein